MQDLSDGQFVRWATGMSVPTARDVGNRQDSRRGIMADKAPIKIVGDQLVMGPVTVGFQRTLRIPETGLHYLPPGLGRFPLRRVEDYPTPRQPSGSPAVG